MLGLIALKLIIMSYYVGGLLWYW